MGVSVMECFICSKPMNNLNWIEVAEPIAKELQEQTGRSLPKVNEQAPAYWNTPGGVYAVYLHKGNCEESFEIVLAGDVEEGLRQAKLTRELMNNG